MLKWFKARAYLEKTAANAHRQPVHAYARKASQMCTNLPSVVLSTLQSIQVWTSNQTQIHRRIRRPHRIRRYIGIHLLAKKTRICMPVYACLAGVRDIYSTCVITNFTGCASTQKLVSRAETVSGGF